MMLGRTADGLAGIAGAAGLHGLHDFPFFFLDIPALEYAIATACF
jgi:hypothetical protein